MNKQEYIKELKEEIAYAKKMIDKGDHVEERKQEIKDMQDELHDLMSGEFKNRSEDKEIHRHLCNCGGMWTPYRRIGGYDDE